MSNNIGVGKRGAWSKAVLAVWLLHGLSGFAVAQTSWNPVGPNNASVFALVESPHDEAELLLGTFFGGLYRTRDRGIQWTHMASPFSSAPVFAIAYHPTQAGVVYVGTFGQGLFKTTDDGASWIPLNSGLPDTTLSDVALDPASPNTVLVASESGVFRSVDDGVSFQDVTGGLNLSARTLAFDPSQAGRVYLGTRELGAYRSSDSGQTWQPFSDGLGAVDVNRLGFSPDGSILYAATNSGAFALSSGLAPWSNLTFDLPDGPVNHVVEHSGDGRVFAATATGVFTLAPSASNWSEWTARPSRLVHIDAGSNLVYVASLGSEFVATLDDGQTFFDIDSGIQNLFSGALAAVDVGGESVVFGGSDNGVHITSRFFEQDGKLPWFEDVGFDEVVFVLVPHPSQLGTLFAGTESTGVWKSTDWGVTWQTASDGIVPTKIFALSESPMGSQTLYAATNAGLYVSRDDGASWAVARGFAISLQILDVLADPVLPGVAYVATTDGKIHKTIDDGASFQSISTGLSGDPILKLGAAPFGNLYAVTSSGTIYASSDEGQTWFPTGADVPEPVLSLATDPVIPWKAYVGTNGGGVYRTSSAALTWEPVNVGLDIPFVFTVAVDPSDGDVVYAGSVDTIYKSTDGGDQWSALTSGLPAGFVQAIEIDDDTPSTLYAFVAGFGVVKSEDSGQTWAPSVTGAAFAESVALATSYAAPDKLFFGSSFQGVFVTEDAGASYSRASDGMTLFVRGLDVSRTSPDVLYAGSLGGGVFKSTDGAVSWANRGLQERNIFTIVINPQNQDNVFAATSLGVAKTDDGGLSWIELGQKTSVIFSMVADPADRDRVFIGSVAGSVFASTDGGVSWARADQGLPPANILALTIDPNDGALYASAERVGVYKSTDDAASWTPTNPTTIGAAQVLSLSVDPRDSALFAAAADSGLFRSLDGGDTWESIVNGFGGEVARQIVIDPTTNTWFATALNQTGIFLGVSRSTDGGATWSNSSSGLTVESVESLAMDPSNTSILYAATPAGVFRSADGGASWVAANSGMETIETIRVLVDPSDSNIVFAATRGSGVFRSLDAGASWEQSNLPFAGVDASRIAVGADLGDFYLASLTNGFFETRDGGDTWTGGIEPSLAEPIVTYLAMDPQDPSRLFAAASGVGLLRTLDAGLSWEIVGDEIGNPFILAIAFNPADSNTIYVGTSGSGVWFTEDGGDTWAPLNDGLFNHNVTSLLVDPADPNIVYVGTEGGGVFSIDRTPPPMDTDGDGVTDALDCAPNDPLLATLHTFYHDYDRDSFGIHRVEPTIPPDFEIETAVDVCRLAPGLGFVAWANDPWDFDGFEYLDTIPKNGRLFATDFGATAQDGAFPDEELVDLGADAVPLHVVWSDVESSAGSFDGPQASAFALANDAYASKNLKLSLTLSPVVSGLLTVPNDLVGGLSSGALRFDDPAVVERFSNVLTFVHGQMPDVELLSLQIGYEIDKLAPSFPDSSFWIAYTEFHRVVSEHAKSLWGDELLVSSLWSAEGFLDATLDPLRALLDTVDDVLSLTYFPRRADFTVYEPIEIPQQLIDIAQKAFPRKIFFQDIGYPSAPITGSSTTKQAQFLYAFFEYWDQTETQVLFASFGSLHDRPRAQAELLADSPLFRDVGPDLRERLIGYLGSLGWRTFPGGGEHKPGYNTLRNHTFDRGWFRDVERTVRPFHLGFTQAPYDFPPDGPTQVEVSNWIRSRFITDADVTLIHIDGGVPWVEALADDFSSPVLPYSDAVRGAMITDLSSIPAGHKIAVAINPLGVPRHLLAPYWGYGEGFDFDEDFNRVPNGQFADGDKRALPSPWDTYDFDTPQVRTAFLNYAKRIIQFFDPDYLVVGIEVSAALVQSQERYEKYFEMHQWLYEQLKADPLYQHIPVMVSFSSTSYMVDEFGDAYKIDEQEPGVRAAQVDAFRRFLPYTDIVGLSHYPHFGRWNAYTMSAMLYDEFYDLLEQFGAADKPVAISEGGFTADPYDIFDGFVYTGTPEKQDRHFQLLFRELARHSNPTEFIINFKVRDSDIGWQRQVDAIGDETGQGSADFVEFLQFFRDIGIYDGDGNLRPAGARWRSELSLPRIPTLPPATELTLTHSGGDLVAKFNLDVTKRLVYSLELGGNTLVGSSLGITVDGIDLGRNVSQFQVSAPVVVAENYATLGGHSQADAQYSTFTITAMREGAGDSDFQVDVRMYDEAVAYRYVVPGAGTRYISSEVAEWSLPPGSRLFYQDDVALYERPYQEAFLGAVDSTLGGPVTLQLPDGTYLLLAEANVGRYSGMSYIADGSVASKIRSQFVNDPEWPVQGGDRTPWRIVHGSQNLDALVSSDVVTSLNEPPDPILFPDGAATDWIRPGRALYSIWTDAGSGFDYNVQIQYVDYATALGFEYIVVGPGWEIGFPYFGFANPWEALANLVYYGRSDGRDVGVFVWKTLGELELPEARAFFFDVLEIVGASGVMVDVLAGESQATNALLEDVLADAAARGLMVNLTNAPKPSGETRTYPNLMTREAVRGLEWNRLEEDNSPQHNALIPFTRSLVGPTDYRPVTLDPAELGMTSVAHQLAMAGLAVSPLQTWSVEPDRLLAESEVLDVVHAMPSTWDETRVLNETSLGASAFLARRTGTTWFLFAVNGSSDDVIDLPAVDLSFLGTGLYDAVLIGDSDPTSFLRTELSSVEASTSLPVVMSPGSGFVGMFTLVGP